MHILIDIGGTNTRITSSQNLEGFSEPVVLSTPQNYSEGIQVITSTITEICPNKKLIDGVVIGLPGVLNEKKSKLLKSPNLPDWEQKPIYKDLMMFIGKEPMLANDSALAALGEAHLGASKSAHISTYINLGTGVGGARIVDGEIDHAIFGMEPGHMLLGDGVDIETKYKHAIQHKDLRALSEIVAILLVNTTLVWSPEVIVFNGGLTKSELFSLPKITQMFTQKLNMFPQKPRLVLSVLGETAGLFGAMIYAGTNKK